jgi:hypothetical protein
MIDYEKLIEFIGEEIESEKRQLDRCTNINSSGAGMAIGAHDAYQRVLSFIGGELDD